MLTEDRYSSILEIVNRQGSATLTELCTMLDTSESTIRRDLIYLDEKGALIKVRGGARSNTDNTFAMTERNVDEKEKLFAEEKEAIAKYAASLIEEKWPYCRSFQRSSWCLSLSCPDLQGKRCQALH